MMVKPSKSRLIFFLSYLLSFFLFQFLQNSSKECEPYRTSEGLPIAPCGAIANSLFNGEWNLVTEGCDFAPRPASSHELQPVHKSAAV